MRSAGVLIVIAAIGCKSNSKSSDPAHKQLDARVDARSRPDAVEIDAGPADARPYTMRPECPYDSQETETAARAVWGPPPDAGVVVRCAPAAVAPDQALVLYGYAVLDNRYEVHTTIVKATPGHSVIADSYHRTTDAKQASSDHVTDEIEAADLDGDGIDELIDLRTMRPSAYDEVTSSTLTVMALRNGALVSAAPVACAGNYRLIEIGGTDRPRYDVEIAVRAFGAGSAGCLAKGKHRFAWDPAALALTEH